MSNIPQNRDHLLDLITAHYAKLRKLIKDLSDEQGNLMVDDTFSIKDLTVIRTWWLEAVQRWITDGLDGKTFPLPAEGYKWNETPALNLQTAQQHQDTSLHDAREKLHADNYDLLRLISSLDDHQLTEVGVFEWAGKWPVMRWISVGSSSQYDGATKQIRKTLKSAGLL